MRFFALATAVAAASAADDSCAAVTEARRISCAPDGGATEAVCAARGCCWSTTDSGAPSCFYPSEGFGYSVQPGSDRLQFQGKGNPFSPDLPELRVESDASNKAVLRLKITDPGAARYEVPLPLGRVDDSALDAPLYEYSQSAQGDFAARVSRPDSGATVFDSSLGPLLYGDQFLQISTALPSSTVYGIGEHISDLALDMSGWNTLSLWAHDQGTPPGYTNLYGSHPFYMVVEDDGSAHGVLLFNSNAMDVDLTPAPGLTFRTIGGVLDLFVLMGPSPVDVMEQYAQLVGLPFMPPRWALGFHICRWGYKSVQDMRDVVDSMREQRIPQDTQWLDIDGFDAYLDFTYDPVAFAGLPEFVEELHGADAAMRFVHIIDPGISNQQPAGAYPPYDRGLEQDVFLRQITGELSIGDVWPGNTAYPDFLHPNATEWWTEQVRTYRDDLGVAVDALWCDMNEVDSNVAGSVDGCPEEGAQWDSPPFLPGIRGKLAARTACPSSPASGGRQYDTHNLYGLSETMATAAALAAAIPDERSFVLSRSTFVSSGHYGGHWLGDNSATWFDMQMSIPGILSFNMFAVPFVGSDICGFDFQTTDELCARWMEVGAFAPFSRNHNSHGWKPQAPSQMDETVATASRNALNTRYELLPTLYSLFHRAHAQGSPVARALAWEFPADAETHAIDEQFLWGADLLITPVLTKGAVTVKGYLPPAARWFDFYTGAQQQPEAGWVELDAPIGRINLHQRGGSVLVTQAPAQTSLLAEKNDMGVLVALDADGAASGSVFFDDYLSPDTLERGQYTLVQFSVRDGVFQASTQHSAGAAPALEAPWTSLRVAGLAQPPADVTGAAVSAWDFDADTGVLQVDLAAGVALGSKQAVEVRFS